MDIPILPDRPTITVISLRRARTVANILAERGIDWQIIQMTYHGKGNPLIPTRDGVPEPGNRRVEITVR